MRNANESYYYFIILRNLWCLAFIDRSETRVRLYKRVRSGAHPSILRIARRSRIETAGHRLVGCGEIREKWMGYGYGMYEYFCSELTPLNAATGSKQQGLKRFWVIWVSDEFFYGYFICRLIKKAEVSIFTERAAYFETERSDRVWILQSASRLGHHPISAAPQHLFRVKQTLGVLWLSWSPANQSADDLLKKPLQF